MSIVETVVALMLGACICMPTDEQRTQDTEAFVNRVNADWAFFTPSVARTLDPTRMPGLKTVLLGGEATSKEIAARWAPNRRLVNCYGPCECTVYFSFAELHDESADVRNVGIPPFNGYIVSPDDVNILIEDEVGTGALAAGELLIQGPSVVRGYLNDNRSGAFVDPPTWYDGTLGPEARFYLTGDIAERCKDGSIRILGRKDRQVKIRGQKVDLDEIRHHFLSSIPELHDFVALFEGFSTTQQHRRHELVAFVVPRSSERQVAAKTTPMTEALLVSLTHTSEALQEVVARYMLPTLFIPLTAIPLTAHSKLDLHTLRALLASLSPAQERRFALHDREFEPLVTEDELILGEILAVQLALPVSDINRNMGFVQLGGDSIKAMSVAKELGHKGKYLPVETALLSSTIKEMAEAITPAVASSSLKVPTPFSLLSAGNTEIVRQEAAKACGVPEEAVHDVFPCTSLQEGFLAVSSRDNSANVARYVFKMGEGADAYALSAAWLATVSTIETLRTRFFPSSTEGLVQVVVDDGDWSLSSFEKLPDLLKSHNSSPFGLGSPMVRAGLVRNPRLFVLSIHHAIFDLFTLRLILHTLKAAYTQQALPPVLPFTIALDERRGATSAAASEAFWKSTLQHSSVSNWPVPAPTNSSPAKSEWVHCSRKVKIPSKNTEGKTNTTVATYLQAAWALLLGAYQGSDDVAYAMAVSGRESNRCDPLQIAGPMLATCPLRLHTSEAGTVGGLLAYVRKTVLETTRHAHLGIQRIARLGEDERRACTLRTMLVVQPDLTSTTMLEDIDLHLDTELTQEEALGSYACWVECIPSGDHLTLKMEYMPEAVGVDGPSILQCLEHLFCVLIQAVPDDTVSKLPLFPSQGLAVAHPRHEADVTEVCQQTVHEYIFNLNVNQKHLDRQAVVGWDGEITYRELDQLSERLALRLRNLGLAIGDVVPFHTHKSIWTVVGILAVLRAGGTIMFLDINNPTSRNKELLSQLHPYPTLMLCSPGTEQFWSADVKCTVELGADLKSDTNYSLAASLPQVPPETVAYLFFTSGTSGTPKGIEVEHRAYLTAALARLDTFERKPRSRVLQVTPFSFDVSIDDMWTTLLAGGAIIMPSEAERLDDLAGSIARYAATDVSLTPTVATLLLPDQVPSLEALVLAGESPSEALYDTWLATSVRLYNAYGPTECSILATATRAVPGDPRNIGHVLCGRAWVTHPENPHVRMPLGAVGELLIEGPSLARGYYRNEAATLQSFVVNLQWSSPERRFYRTGDLVRANLDGSFTYLRRRDQQVKLRGVRIEVGEIEAKLLSAGVGVVHEACVDIVKSQGKEALAALCTMHGDSAQWQTQWQVLIAPVVQSLRARLPRYMMPTLIIPLPSLPATVTGKLDRKKLRSIVSNISADELQTYTASHLTRHASSQDQKSDPDWALATPELTLAKDLWIEALDLGTDGKMQISPLSNFFDYGGDSVVAMRLVALCRSRCQRQIGVADIYDRPTLMDLAFALREPTESFSKISSSPATAPFSMLGPWRQHSAVLNAIHKQLVDVEIEDVYPCTAFQEGVMAISAQQQGSYVAKYQFSLSSPDPEAARLRNALRQVVAANPILRTRIIYVDGFGYFQAVLAASDLMDPLTEAHDVIVRPWEQESPLVQFSLAATGSQPELWSYASHAVFDAITWDLFLAQLNAAYISELQPNTIAPYAAFVQARARTGQEDDAEFHDFWLQTLGDAEHTTVFPDSRQERVETTQFFEVDMDVDVGDATKGITDATQLHAAWALTLSVFSAAEDVVFGSVMSERSLGIQDGDRIMGPCVATVPVRSRLDQARGRDLHTWLSGEQRNVMQVLSHAPIGPAQIECLDSRALQFDTIIQIISPSSEQHDDDLIKLVASGPAYENSGGYFTTPLVLEMKPGKGRLSIEAIFNATVAPPDLVSNMIHTLFNIIKQLRSAGTCTTLADMKIYSPAHRDQIATWNSFAPQQAHSTAPQLISHWAQSSPNKVAIEAWDGILTFSEIEEYASTLALYIQSNFALSPAEETIAICFSRSRWVPVVMLAVQRLKRAYLALEPSHPTQRLLQLVQQSGAKLILAEAKQTDRFAGLSQVLTFDQKLQDRLLAVHEGAQAVEIVTVEPSDPAVVVYTSGSTGLPKAILLQQSALCSAIASYGSRMDFGPTNRTLQNAAFAFDIHACEIFLTLAHGGCLVIADAANGLAHLSSTIRKHEINWLFMTPSTMHLLPHPDEIPSVKTLMMIGETPTRSIVEKWADPTKVHLINAYGPAENTLFSTMYSFRAKHEDPTTIGLPVGCTAWVVSPHDIDVLLPVGCTGELLLKGPQIAREYLSQPDETARRFVKAPRWITDFDVDGGNDSRFYKTGDLVRYEADGMLHFIGRIDSQAKLNGQRLELAEVEHYVSSLLHGVRVAAEIIEPQGGAPTLAAFIEDPDASVILSKENLTSKLHASLPSFMVPSLFVRVHELPQTSSKKLDRKALKAMASSQTFQELNALTAASATAHRASITTDVKNPPRTPAERLLQTLWKKVLTLPASDIGVDESFFELGGNSIHAIRLATLISAEGSQSIRIPTSSIFQNPRLKDMAVLLESDGLQDSTNSPTVAVATFNPEILDYCAKSLAIPPASVQDIYSCTPLQERMLVASAMSSNAYMAELEWAVPLDINVKRFKDAWRKTINAFDILRTEFVSTPANGTLQVVAKPGATSAGSSIFEDAESHSEQRLSSLKLVPLDDRVRGRLKLVWRVHHALFDEWTLLMVQQTVSGFYNASEVPSPVQFKHFIEYLENADRDTSRGAHSTYWTDYLQDVAVTPFPNPDAKSLDSPGKPHHRLKLSTSLHPAHSMTAGTIARAAWALVLTQYTNSDTVLFGATLSGRNAGLNGIESVCGPTLATVPVRVRIPKGQNVPILAFLQTLQDEAVQMMPHEHHVSDVEDVRRFCDFQNVLSVVQSPSSEDLDPLFQPIDDDSTTSTYHTIPLCIEYSLDGENSTLQTIFDSNAISTVQMMRILKQIDHVAQQLQRLGPEATVDNIEYLSTPDKQELETWNQIRPEPVREFIDHIMAQEVARRPDAQAVCAHDGDLTYARFDELAQRLADILQNEHGTGPGDVVPLCFEKSLWAMVAMFGVLKTGAAFVPTDPAQPAGRLQEIVSQIQPRVLLVSDKTSHYDFATSATLIVLNEHALNRPTQYQTTNRALPQRDPSDLAYIIFTSGSTGKPKGVMITHESYRTGAKPRRTRLARHEKIRIIQFSTFSFDTSIEDTLTTWTYGGCVCVPSEWERLNDLEGAMNRMRVTGAHITPSLADALNPANVPTLRHIHFGGEKMTPRALQRWASLDGPVDIRNVYGPTESSISTSCTVRLGPDSNPINIGFPIGCNLWITDAKNHDRLMPIGCVGELLIEGHLLAKGYLNNPEKTAEVFITNPAWAESPNSSITRRFYKTGDLACYADDGSIVCLGRKDSQVNLNGYRIETGEVEVNLRNLLDDRVHDLAVEVVIPKKNNPTATPLLVAFLSMAVSYSGLQDTSSNIEDTPRAKGNLARVLREARLPDSLRAVLPSYMIPTAFVPITCMPQSIARKTDRGALQQLASHLSAQELRSFVEAYVDEDEEDYMEFSPPPSSPPLTSTTALPTPPSTTADPILLLQELFATVVGLDREYVNMDHSFIRLGGDSIHALRFVAAARRNGFSAMTVVEALQANALQDLASLYDSDSPELVSSPAPAPGESETVLHSIAGLDIPSSEIEASQPATSFQRLAFEVSLLPLRGYMNTFSFTFNGPVHFHRLEHALERLIARHGILRTVFLESQDPKVGLLQVVLRHRLSDEPRLAMVESDADFTSIMPATGYGKPLVRFTLQQGPQTKLILCISHGLYDAVGIDTLCHDLSVAYRGTPFECDPAPQFHSFVASMPPRNDSREFWKRLLHGSRTTEITGSTIKKGVENSEIKVRMRCPPPSSSGSANSRSHQYTFATYLKAAWALVLANNSSASAARGKFDVVFGHGVTTRSIAPSESTDHIVGPCLDIVPVRVIAPSATLDASSAGALLHSIHSQHLSGLPHHAYGLSDIVRDCTNWLSGENSDAKASVNCISTVVAHHGLEEAPPTIQLQDGVSAQAVVKPRLFGGWDLWVISTVVSESQDGSSEVDISMMYCSDTLAEERVRMLLHALVAEVHRLRLLATL